jgi:hypothetical protein
VGVGASVALAIGAATVSFLFFTLCISKLSITLTKKFQICDMFFQAERGRFMGFYALAITNGVCILFSSVFMTIEG